MTFYDHSIMDTRNPVDMSLRGGSGITYQHYRGVPMWEFGFGLSYTTFEFKWAAPPRWTSPDASADAAAVATGRTLLTYTVTVKNTGKRASGVAVLAFVNGSGVQWWPDDHDAAAAAPSPPVRELFNFTRVWLEPGASTRVEFTLEPDILANTDHLGVQAVRPGPYAVAVGGVGRSGRPEDGAVTAPLFLDGKEAVIFSMAALRSRHEAKTNH